MKKLLLMATIASSMAPISAIYAESAFDLEGKVNTGAYRTLEGSSDFSIDAEIKLTADELSVVDYRYGAFVDLSLDEDQTGDDVLAESYGIYVEWDRYAALVSNDLTLDETPTTSLAFGEGILEQWASVQPINGAAAYKGQFRWHG